MGLLGRRGIVRNVEVVKVAPVSYDFMQYDDQFHRAFEAFARGSWVEAQEIYDTRTTPDKRSARLSEECFARIADRPIALPWRYIDNDIAAGFTRVRDGYLAGVKDLVRHR